MKESYTFYALDYRRYVLMFLGVVFSFKLILRNVISRDSFILLFESCSEKHITLVILFVFITLVILFVFIIFIANKLAFSYAEEKWTISFDSKEIEISSNRRMKKTFLISQLRGFIFSRSKQSKWTNKTVKNIRMSFRFKKKWLPPQYMITANEFIFSKSFRKDSYNILSQFLDSFYKQILETQFQKKIEFKTFRFYRDD
ncbi:MAG: hypothetical protein J6568_04900 [Snodgrassella sp.]|nr:hypothetical protein [Snodgrassella sp.]